MTAERLRFRHRRQLRDDYDGTVIHKQNAINEIALTRPLTILDDTESSEGPTFTTTLDYVTVKT